jgi:tRNA G26 N,N-dimethylase Trm1
VKFQVDRIAIYRLIYHRLSLGIDTIYANDIDAGAVESIKQNVELNNVKNLVQASHDDAMNLLYSHRKIDDQFHVVDLDPYGTPAQFLGKYISFFFI